MTTKRQQRNAYKASIYDDLLNEMAGRDHPAVLPDEDRCGLSPEEAVAMEAEVVRDLKHKALRLTPSTYST